MKIKEVANRTGITERQVRYLIAEGFIPAPSGGRAHAQYGPEHVDGILRYSRLRALGFPPAAIKLLLQAKDGAPFSVMPGVTLVIDPQLLASGAPVAPVVEKIQTLLSELFKEPSDASDRASDNL